MTSILHQISLLDKAHGQLENNVPCLRLRSAHGSHNAYRFTKPTCSFTKSHKQQQYICCSVTSTQPLSPQPSTQTKTETNEVVLAYSTVVPYFKTSNMSSITGWDKATRLKIVISHDCIDTCFVRFRFRRHGTSDCCYHSRLLVSRLWRSQRCWDYALSMWIALYVFVMVHR